MVVINNFLKPKGWFYFSTPNKKNLKDNSKWHKSVFNESVWVKLLKQHFKWPSHGELWGQDQYGLTDNLNKPYIVGRVQV